MKKLTTIVLGAALLLGSTAYAEKLNGYEIPVYDKETKTVTLNGEIYRFHKERESDINKNGVNDTFFQYFKGDSKHKITRYVNLETGKVWQWHIKATDDITSTTDIYGIIDTDGDGKLDQVLPGAKYKMPKYLK